MERKWRAFDRETINAEFRRLTSDDWFRLTAAMKAYANDLGVGYEIKSYGNGIMMIKDAGAQGRCLFFAVRFEEDDIETLTALRVYKKEGQKAPRHEIDVAKRRMRESR